MVRVETVYGDYSYEVFDIEVYNQNIKDYKKGLEGEVLIMYTCYPFGITEDVKTDRIFVYAKLIEDKISDTKKKSDNEKISDAGDGE